MKQRRERTIKNDQRGTRCCVPRRLPNLFFYFFFSFSFSLSLFLSFRAWYTSDHSLEPFQLLDWHFRAYLHRAGSLWRGLSVIKDEKSHKRKWETDSRWVCYSPRACERIFSSIRWRSGVCHHYSSLTTVSCSVKIAASLKQKIVVFC